MDDRVTVRDIMSRTFVGVSEGDTIAGAADLMHEERDDFALVMRGKDPIGLIGPRDIVDVIARNDNPTDVSVDEAMRQPLVTIGPDQPLTEAVDVMVDKDVRPLVVIEDEGVVGVLTPRDLVTAPTGVPEASTPGTPPGEAIEIAVEMTEDEATRTAEDGAYSSQGVCEVCGTLTAELRDVNGQLVCADCRTVS